MPMRTIRAPNVNVVTVLSPQMITLSSRLEHVNISAIQTQVCELCGGNYTIINYQVLLHRHLLNKLIMCQTSRGNKTTCILIPTILARETIRICHKKTLKIH